MIALAIIAAFCVGFVTGILVMRLACACRVESIFGRKAKERFLSMEGLE